MALSTGSLLAGRYEITAPVAVGGMGEVWQARDRVLDRVVAAKVLKSELTGDPNFLARFRNEARHTAALSHPNIASVYDYGETLDERGITVAYLVMEFVEGQPLVSVLHEEGRMPVDWTLHVLGQAADGLSAAHRAGVVHRDIKPGNIMVRPDGVVKLTDFGIAQARDAAPLTRTGMVVGTAQYLSPEQAQGMEVTAASDVYSLGVVGYECLTGVRPFDGSSQVAVALAHINRPPPPLPGDVPPPVQALIGRALAKDPAQRFPDGGAFAEAVRTLEHRGGPASGGLPPVTGAGGATTEVMAEVGDPTGTRVLGGPVTGAAAAGAAGAAATGRAPGTAARPLPPLQLTDDDEPLPGRAGPGEPRPRRRPWGWIAAALVVLVLLGVGGYVLLSGSGGSGTGTGPGTATTTVPSAGTSAGPQTVTVDAAALVGEPYATAVTTLQREGLVVRRATASSAQLRDAGVALAAGDVAAVSPDGTVRVGDTVTLSVAATAYDPTATSSTTSAPRTTAAPTTTTAPTRSSATTSSSAPTTTAAPTTTVSPAPLPGSPAPSGGGGDGGGGGGRGGGGGGGQNSPTAGASGGNAAATGPGSPMIEPAAVGRNQ